MQRESLEADLVEHSTHRTQNEACDEDNDDHVEQIRQIADEPRANLQHCRSGCRHHAFGNTASPREQRQHIFEVEVEQRDADQPGERGGDRTAGAGDGGGREDTHARQATLPAPGLRGPIDAIARPAIEATQAHQQCRQNECRHQRVQQTAQHIGGAAIAEFDCQGFIHLHLVVRGELTTSPASVGCVLVGDRANQGFAGEDLRQAVTFDYPQVR